ncbi:cutinase family protein [Nocardioides coralli]|uniref:RCC1 domain-containing protein n=1 Tax=Nocardioides coralli TaxID=2872154 RepID=UPI001CA3ECC3|nr:endonuclease/exonuclease/phosphatase family protein [Nocardioides coralli]QZY30042.1 cutinase family protein [Nocardioides coralli]
MRRLVPCALLALPLVLGGIPGLGAPAAPPAAAAAPATAPCPDAVVLAATGGGQGRADDPGPTLSGLTAAIVAEAGSVSRSAELQVVSTGTTGPARLKGRGGARTPAGRAVTSAAWQTWRAPAAELEAGLATALDAAVDACPDVLVHLVGYSQGAEAVHRLVEGADADLRSRTVGVVLVGDPARVAGSRGPLVGTPAADRGARGVTTRFSRPRPTAVPGQGWYPPVHAVCTRGDVACDLGSTPFRTAKRIHASYDEGPVATRLTEIGRRLGARTALWPRPVAGQEATGRAGLLLTHRLKVKVAPSARERLRFAAVDGVPPGLSLTSRGELRGTPTAAGTWELAFTVHNARSRALSRRMPGTLTVTIQPAARTQVSAGGRHTCEVRPDGTLWCWGANGYGQLGVGDKTSGATPRQVGSRDDWAGVSAGGMHSCGVRDNGSLWCWGLNYRGQLGLGGRTDKTEPHRVGKSRSWATVSAGWVHTCATRVDGSAWCWGDNDHGQLGNGGSSDSRKPVAVTRGMVWQQLAAGGWHTCGVNQSGEAWCWGRNSRGQVGDGTTTVRLNPARVGGGTDWARVAPAWTHSCGLRQDGSLSCWGGNEGGQVGGGGFGGSATPREVAPGRSWSALDTGVNFSCALDTSQQMWCWGTGRSGQLDGAPSSEQPVPVRAGTSWAQLDLGWLFACGLHGPGARPTCWGSDETGELGPSPSRSRTTEAARSEGGFTFTLATFNVLGSNHTTPRSNAGEFSPARVRTEWAVDYLRSINAGVVGFQELQRDQLDWFRSTAGSDYDVWPGTSLGGKGLQTTLAWKRDLWRFVKGDTVEIPFITQKRHMPLVKLEHRKTGRHIWVMNVHNAPRDYQSQRETATAREIARLQKVVGGSDPVFLVGDFNERDRAFCEVTGKLGLVAPRGGSHDGRCRPPSGFTRVDWIFGSPEATYSRYREDKSPLVRLMTDHAVLRTRVSVP